MATELRSFAPATTVLPELRIGALAAALMRRLAAWGERRCERDRVLGLSDQALRDMGASRGDMEAAARRL